MSGRIITVVGPSGAGKDTLLNRAVARCPDLVLVRRVITRPADAGGEAHEAVTQTEFRARQRRGALALHWQAHGHCYGIPREAELLQRQGRVVVFNGSRAALPAARAVWPSLEVIVVTAPAHLLAARLAERGRESAEAIAARLERSQMRLPTGAKVVMNDGTLAQGVARFLDALNLSAQSA